MNRLEHILTVIAEEASEAAQEACKCLRFGPDTKHETQTSTNLERLRVEYSQLVGMMQLLDKELVRVGKPKMFDPSYVITKKKASFEAYLEVSRGFGTYNPES